MANKIDKKRRKENRWFTLKWHLDMGSYPNAELQKDWNEHGPEAFSYEVLEQKDAGKVEDIRWELKKMKKKWLEKLQP